MQRCLELASRAEGRTAPNPMVGAVIVASSGRIIAEGFHAGAGQDHAEIVALKQAGQEARGSSLYVSLEPCCHFGRTPPCTEAIIRAGIKRVIYGCPDNNPQVAHKGKEKLLAAGIEVIHGVLENECYFINRAFFKRMATGLPWIILKIASTLDGSIADRQGKSKWITGPEARQIVHELRNKCEAILTTSGTILADNPELTVRGVENALNPQRLIIDTFQKVPLSARIFARQEQDRDFAQHPIIVFCKTAEHNKTVKHSATGALDILYLSTPTILKNGKERIDLKAAFALAAEHDINTILVESGGTMNGALLEEGLVDEVYWFIAPKVLTDSQAIKATAGSRPHLLENSLNLHNNTIRACGPDVLIHGLYKP